MIKYQNHFRGSPLVAVLGMVVLFTFTSGVLAQDAPVTIAVSVTGDPLPGATVTAKATITINDGSTVQSLTWSQTGGLDALLFGTTLGTVSVTMPSRDAFKEELVHILHEAPSETGPLPGNVPIPSPFHGGLQNRFSVVGITPLAIEEAGAVTLNLEVKTSSGTFTKATAIHAHLPWPMSTGIRNVPIDVPVLLHGVDQATYDWTLSARPVGSTAALIEATTQNPDFVPDLPGTYELTVTNLETAMPITFTVIAGTWKGVIKGEDADGRPVANSDCTVCHTSGTKINQFAEWKVSGHSEILTQNVNNPAGHYSTNCVSCHTVGYNLDAENGGFDDAADFAALVESDRLTHGDAENWTRILEDFPASAQMMNIQCENCHGPQNSEAHDRGDETARVSLASNVCGTCHGEPLRHGRYQQWQLSGHANYELAIDEASSGGCAKCHTANGFLAWEEEGFAPSVSPKVTWTPEEAHPQTCATCHEPHNIGSTTGDGSNATVRITGETPMLMSGYVAKDVGRAAVCMTCHNGRRGLRDDDNYNAGDAARAPHRGPQTDILMGRNLFFTEVGTRGFHSMIEDSCVTCHMEATDPPTGLSYNQGGTNHTFYASEDICAKCHTEITAESIQGPVHEKLEALKHEIETALMGVMRTQILLGNRIDLNGTMVTDAADILEVEFTESHGRQAVSVTLPSGVMDHVSLANVDVVRPGGSAAQIYAVADPMIAKAGWNYLSVEADGSMGVHNTSFVNAGLEVATFAIKVVNAALADPTVGGGPGNNAGAVSCTTPYVYWAEIAGHIGQWRTDLVARNLSSSSAAVEFYLHEASGTLSGSGVVAGGGQKVFEDVVGSIGGMDNLGSLEICSDRPLLVMSRIFNLSPDGTYGQAFDGHVAGFGYSTGQTVSLIGMRQLTGAYRTNLSVTNGGGTEAEVSITLFDSAGAALHTYRLTVPAGQVVQDIQPFANRANLPDVDWGYATVTVLNGTNVQTSASMADMKTNDPTTIPAKQ